MEELTELRGSRAYCSPTEQGMELELNKGSAYGLWVMNNDVTLYIQGLLKQVDASLKKVHANCFVIHLNLIFMWAELDTHDFCCSYNMAVSRVEICT